MENQVNVYPGTLPASLDYSKQLLNIHKAVRQEYSLRVHPCVIH